MVYPCNEIKKIAWSVLKNFDHAIVLRNLVVTKETMTVEGMIKMMYDLLRDKLNITKITFSSGNNTATCEYDVKRL